MRYWPDKGAGQTGAGSTALFLGGYGLSPRAPRLALCPCQASVMSAYAPGHLAPVLLPPTGATPAKGSKTLGAGCEDLERERKQLPSPKKAER